MRSQVALLAALLAVLCRPGGAGASTGGEDLPAVLVIHSYHTEMPWARALQEGVEETIGPEDQRRVRLFVEWGDLVRRGPTLSPGDFGTYLRSKYRDAGVAAVVADGPQAAEYLARNDGIFPGSHLLVIGSRKIDFPEGNAFASVRWVPSNLSYGHTFDLIRRLLPKVRHVEVIADETQRNRERVEDVARDFSAYDHELSISYFTDFTEKSLLAHVAGLPEKTALFYLPVLQDSTGRRFLPGRLLKRLAEKANAPVFSSWGTMLGQGIVGGKLNRGELAGNLLAELALASLRGETAERPARELAARQAGYYFDDRQLRRWNISERLLPEGSTILYQKTSLLQEYLPEVVTTGLLLALQGALIAVLLHLLRTRRRALAEKTAAETELKRFSDRLENLVEERTRELDESRFRLVEMQKAARLGAWEWDLRGGGVFWSEELFSLFGVSPGGFDPASRAFVQALHPEDRDRILTGLKAAAVAGAPYDAEHRIVHPDGSTRHIQVRARTERDGEGRPLRMLGFAFDITDKVGVEEQHRNLSAMKEGEMLSRWLHDNLGADLHHITLLAESVRERKQEPGVLHQQIDCVAEISRLALASVRSYLDFSSRVGVSFEKLTSHMEQYGRLLLTPLGIDCRFRYEAGAGAPSLTGLQSFNLYRIFNESLMAIASRGPGAGTVSISISSAKETLAVTIEESGRGLSDTEGTMGSRNLTTIKACADTIGADLQVFPLSEGGRRMRLSFAL